jgi:hypothetical protein
MNAICEIYTDNICDWTPCAKHLRCVPSVTAMNAIYTCVGKEHLHIFASQLQNTVDACHINPCLNNGTCIANSTSYSFVCNCTGVYIGQTCECMCL